ncbi:PREDICTED: uncharacterized protein LOC109481570 [Branchiostoma belcheri]|uniref:Uncharacterized protein LOC109481570 n=1 Tax=Branchiostoma belcheri TaxID=7741 RepID=A0A6P4ZSC8_BRABE|nr:PREDICTED: uncharacterized protein LOC109481570 [Branchiostoma belcheri]
MGKRRSKKPIFHRRIFDVEDLPADTLMLKTEATRTGYKLNTTGPTSTGVYGIGKNNTNLPSSQGASVPLHFVVLLTLFLLSVTLIFCLGRRRSKSAGSKSASSRRSSGTTTTNSTKVVKRTTSVLGTTKEKGASTCEKKDVQNTKKLIKNNGRRKYY